MKTQTKTNLVECPRCQGCGCSMCEGTGLFTRGAALLWCTLAQTCPETRRKNRIAAYALRQYGEDILAPRPRTPLDDALDLLGIP